MSGFARHIGTGLTVGALVFAAACSSDSVTAPAPQPAAMAPSEAAQMASYSNEQYVSFLTSLFNKSVASALLRVTPLTQDITVSAHITSKGGTIAIPQAGLTLIVPKGAVSKKGLTITVTALAGSATAYEFEPHGSTFAKPLTVVQSLDVTKLGGLKFDFNYTLRGGYFKDVSQIDLKTGKGTVDEVFPVVLQLGKASFDITHFSGYMVSMD